ncbi:MucR family transcriptional regulator [Arenibaculum sp.]|jgi:predicted transcriptional regulator|uniref:MucR family transcriptional regulator n=1 Tax=Arenibaculum sp. TaxID=2865862 RepID=UPI002E15A71E|nr:MucR family transcriptional regulator [Arenibaculum sp.]
MDSKTAYSAPTDRTELVRLTTRIVSAYVRNSTLPTGMLAGLIEGVFGALSGAASPQPAPSVEKPQPAVPINRSIRPDHIVCLEDGKKLKMLKRHLWSRYRMTPDEYRRKWDLPADYPMVAPDYAKQRSYLAKKIGLGRLGREDGTPVDDGPDEVVAA